MCSMGLRATSKTAKMPIRAKDVKMEPNDSQLKDGTNTLELSFMVISTTTVWLFPRTMDVFWNKKEVYEKDARKGS